MSKIFLEIKSENFQDRVQLSKFGNNLRALLKKIDQQY